MRYFYGILLLFWMQHIRAQSPQQGWEFAPSNDNFGTNAVLDLSYLNEDVAGQTGFVRLSPDGEGFVKGDGTPIRFWGVGGGDGTGSYSTAQLTAFAKFLAKKGVNMIRFHGKINSKTNDINAVDQEQVEAIWKLVAAMKQEGIYVTISPFWVGHMGNIPAQWGLGEYVGTKQPWALLYFDEAFQNAYKSWVTKLYTPTNPYTGIALKDDPAVGLIQIKNEDGVFFWTIQGVEPSLKAKIETQFHDWLIEKYGTIAAAYQAWDNLPAIEGDAPNAGRMGIYIIWEATQPQTGGKHKRITDQIAFYTHAQSAFYQKMYDHHRAIGCKQLINASNWKPADAVKLFDAERVTNAVADVMAVNRYYDSGHLGENNGWRVDPGHRYVGTSVLFQPHLLPTNVKQVAGKPFVMSESCWTLPQKYLAEGPFLVAAYASLTGFDTYYWFAPRSPGYDPEVFVPFINLAGGQKPMWKWNVSTPGVMAMFPANALMYRQGYIQEATTVVNEERTLQDIYERKTPVISEESGFDPNRDSYDNQGGTGSLTLVAPVAHLAGKVRVKYGVAESKHQIASELSTLLNFQQKRITSATGQLKWDYAKGVCTVDAPAAQGVVGHFKESGDTVALTDVTFYIRNRYAAINAVSMDGQPLATSEKVLLQVGTRYEPTGWGERAATFELGGKSVQGFQIDNTGRLPWKAANTQLLVKIENTKVKSAHLLDANGYEVEQAPVIQGNGFLWVLMPPNAMYVVLNTEPSTVTALEEDLGMNIGIFPNPSSGRLTIETDQKAEAKFDEIVLTDLSGRVVYHVRFPSTWARTVEANLVSGLYLLQIRRQGAQLATKRVLIQP